MIYFTEDLACIKGHSQASRLAGASRNAAEVDP
jgi:AhpD family alkylhydroperoxidase